MSAGEPDLPEPSQLPRQRPRRWLRLTTVVGIVVVAVWFVAGGYDRLTAPNPRWKLPNGDTIEVLAYSNYYEASYDVFRHRVEGAHSLRLRFRSDFRHPARDRSDVMAAAQVMCPLADSAGTATVKIEPTRPRFLGVLGVSHTYWFRVRHGGACDESEGPA
jgi:hypothetical protein